MKFGEKLRQLRTERGLSQDALAELLGTYKQTISRYENGPRAPKLDMAVEWAKILDVSLIDLINEDAEIVRPGFESRFDEVVKAPPPPPEPEPDPHDEAVEEIVEKLDRLNVEGVKKVGELVDLVGEVRRYMQNPGRGRVKK